MGWLTRAFGGNARAPRDIDSALRAALLAVLDQDHDRAAEVLAVAARLDGDDVDVFVALARVYRMRGEIDRAIRIHQNLLLRSDLSPERKTSVLCELGSDFAQGGFAQRAIAVFEEVVATNKRHVRGLSALVRELVRIDDVERALKFARRLDRLERGERTAPSEAEVLVKVAQQALDAGDLGAARRSAKLAVKRDKTLAEAWSVLGSVESERGKPDAAIAAWSRVPQLDRAQGALVYPLLHRFSAERGKPREFEALLRSLLKEEPDDVDARRALANLLVDQDELESAVIHYRTVLEHDPDDLAARTQLGRLLISQLQAGALLQDVDVLEEYSGLIDTIDRKGLASLPGDLELAEQAAEVAEAAEVAKEEEAAEVAEVEPT